MDTDTPVRDLGTRKLVSKRLVEGVFVEHLMVSVKGTGNCKVSWPKLDSNTTVSRLVPQVPR